MSNFSFTITFVTLSLIEWVAIIVAAFALFVEGRLGIFTFCFACTLACRLVSGLMLLTLDLPESDTQESGS